MRKCTFCGLSQGEKILASRDGTGELENHAYQFIHLKEETLKTMKFDVIVGNPPYQLGDGGGVGSSAMPIYHLFIRQAKLLNPRYMAFIVPSRWFAGGKGLNDFRDEMLHDKRIKKIVDYPNAGDCFPGVEIKGGVNYFVWDREYNGDCEIITIQGDEEYPPEKRRLDEWDVLVRWNKAVPILKKVAQLHEKTLEEKISSRKPFGLNSKFSTNDQVNNPDKVKVYMMGKKTGYMQRTLIQQGTEMIDENKVLFAKAGSVNGVFPNNVIGAPFVADAPSVCTESFLVAGPFQTKEESENFVAYLKTRFARFLILLRTPTQNISKTCFEFVPDLPMDKQWTDGELYKRYGLSDDEVRFIEKMIKEMEP